MDNVETKNLKGRLGHIIQHIPGGGLLFAVLMLVVLGYLGWFYYGADHLDQALYSLRIENLNVTSQPAWIKSSIAEDVYNNGRLDRISLLEPRANAAIAQAFETHNWVKSATRVTKAAGGKVIVDLVYRRPAAMVYYEKQDLLPVTPGAAAPTEISQGFFPIDEDGTVLPTQDFTSDDVWNYFMIIATNARPAGDIGMPYGDVRITEALSLCALLEKYREPFRLQEIYVHHDEVASGPSPWLLSIVTRDKREIIWGHAPRFEHGGEAPAEQKLERLAAWLQQSPASSGQQLDLRRSTGSTVSSPL